MIVSEAENIRRALILSQNKEFEAIDNNSHTLITGATNLTQKSHGSLLHGGSYIKPELMKRYNFICHAPVYIVVSMK